MTVILKLVGTMPVYIDRYMTLAMGFLVLLDTCLANTIPMLSCLLLPSFKLFKMECISSGVVGLWVNDRMMMTHDFLNINQKKCRSVY